MTSSSSQPLCRGGGAKAAAAAVLCGRFRTYHQCGQVPAHAHKVFRISGERASCRVSMPSSGVPLSLLGSSSFGPSVRRANEQALVDWQGNQRKGMDSLFALTSWLIWKERNARCFREAATMIPELLMIIKAEADQWAQVGAKNLRSLASGG